MNAIPKQKEAMTSDALDLHAVPDSASAFLELKNLSKSYGTGTHVTQVLKDINLTIREGEFVAIVGFSGSGKTTLISLIAGLIQADAPLLGGGYLPRVQTVPITRP